MTFPTVDCASTPSRKLRIIRSARITCPAANPGAAAPSAVLVKIASRMLRMMQEQTVSRFSCAMTLPMSNARPVTVKLFGFACCETQRPLPAK